MESVAVSLMSKAFKKLLELLLDRIEEVRIVPVTPLIYESIPLRS